jgi:hypothetical protein
MDNSNKIILDLCGGTGAWSRPYREAGYDVRNITLPDYEVRFYYYNEKYVVYEGGITFARHCEICGRFVKADKTIMASEMSISDEPNATCKKCGRTHMIFLGYY